jgi:type IV secretory pathway VirB4 component
MAAEKPTQDIIPIKEIRDGVIILKDNSMCSILMASTLNFALKSEDERNAIIMQYQNFLNSLDFPVQFFIESRKLDITPYLSLLKEAEKKQANELLKIQIREYVEFVKNFVAATNIVSKTFYIVVSYSYSVLSTKRGVLGDLFSIFGGSRSQNKKEDQFEEKKLQLQQRTDVVYNGLARCGIRVLPLDTEQLIELFYKLFNPGELEKELITNNK